MNSRASRTLAVVGLTCLLVISARPSVMAAGLRDQAVGYREDGFEAQRHGDLANAMTSYQKAIALDPSYAVPLNDLGVVYEQRGEFQAARGVYERALRIDPNYLEANANLGTLYKRMGYPGQALPRLLKAGLLYEQGGNLLTAKALYEQVLDLEPDHREALTNLAALDERLGNVREAFLHWMKLGMLHEQSGEFESARMAYERAAALDTESVDAQTNVALLYERLGQHDLAVTQWVKLGYLDEQRGDFVSAQRAYERALSLDPNSIETLASLAVVSEQLGNREQAIAYWVKCSRLSAPDDPWRLRAEERLVALGVLKAGPLYRRYLVEQEFQAQEDSLHAFKTVTDQRHW